MKNLEKDQKAELEALKKEVETQYAQLNQRNEQVLLILKREREIFPEI